MRVGINDTFKEFCCGGMQRNRAVGRERCVSRLALLFAMGEITVHLYADGNEPVENENLMLQERGEDCWSDFRI